MNTGKEAGALFRARRITFLLCLLLLIGGGLWYARPVGLEILYPGMEPELFDISMRRFYEAGGTQTRSLRLAVEDPGFDEALSLLKALRFRRPLTNLVLQAIPPLANGPSQSKQLEEGMIYNMYLLGLVSSDSGDWNAEGLVFWVDEWFYTGNTLWGGSVRLPLKMSDSGKIGQAMGQELWEIATPVESNS